MENVNVKLTVRYNKSELLKIIKFIWFYIKWKQQFCQFYSQQHQLIEFIPIIDHTHIMKVQLRIFISTTTQTKRKTLISLNILTTHWTMCKRKLSHKEQSWKKQQNITGMKTLIMEVILGQKTCENIAKNFDEIVYVKPKLFKVNYPFGIYSKI